MTCGIVLHGHSLCNQLFCWRVHAGVRSKLCKEGARHAGRQPAPVHMLPSLASKEGLKYVCDMPSSCMKEQHACAVFHALRDARRADAYTEAILAADKHALASKP